MSGLCVGRDDAHMLCVMAPAVSASTRAAVAANMPGAAARDDKAAAEAICQVPNFQSQLQTLCCAGQSVLVKACCLGAWREITRVRAVLGGFQAFTNALEVLPSMPVVCACDSQMSSPGKQQSKPYIDLKTWQHTCSSARDTSQVSRAMRLCQLDNVTAEFSV